MIPPDTVVRAAVRWLYLLQQSTIRQAWSLIQADPAYTDLTQTQYASALEWLSEIGLLSHADGDVAIVQVVKNLPDPIRREMLFLHAIQHAAPAWLPDADLLINDEGALPNDALALADTLKISDGSALLGVRRAHGKVDMERRALVGRRGEEEFLQLLESSRPGSTSHLAKTDDSYGYDILYRHNSGELHFEVKATTRHGRLTIHLSRNEHEVSKRDPLWRLVVVGLDETLAVAALATVAHRDLLAVAPSDSSAEAKWESASFEVGPKKLVRGVSLPGESCSVSSTKCALLLEGTWDEAGEFSWMPTRSEQLYSTL